MNQQKTSLPEGIARRLEWTHAGGDHFLAIVVDQEDKVLSEYWGTRQQVLVWMELRWPELPAKYVPMFYISGEQNSKRERSPEIQAIEILLIEDNPEDVQLTLEGLREPKIPYHVQLATDGEEALKILRREPPHGGTSRPDVILLDLSLPRVGGRELLAEIKSDPNLKDIPVVVLSGTENPADVADAYSNHAAFFITKALELEKYLSTIRSLKELCFNAVVFSRRPKWNLQGA